MNDAPLESSRDCGDTELLGRFSVRHDDDAFAELVRRHGQLVWGVCRRRLDRHEDAEDAFQTTFLQLAMKSRAIHRPEALAAWLHRTATRTSLRLASRSTRELADDLPANGRDAFAEIARKESIAAIDEELLRLPRRSRDAIVLFHLEGLDRKQVATRLGVSEAAVKALLARGRSLLRARLARRGVALPMLLPLAVDPVPAAAADAACRSSVSLVRSGVSPLNFVSLSTKGLPPMLAWITNKSSVAVLVGAACLSVFLVGRGTADGDRSVPESGKPAININTTLNSHDPKQPEVAFNGIPTPDAGLAGENSPPGVPKARTVEKTAVDEAAKRKRLARGLRDRPLTRGASNEALVGELIERLDWKQSISFAPWQSEVIMKLDGVIMGARDDSYIRDADYVEAGHNDYRQHVERGDDRRNSLRYLGQEIVQGGLLTEAQSAYVMFVAYSRGMHYEYGHLNDRLIQSRLNLTSDQLGFLDKLNDWAIIERLQLNHWTRDPAESKFVQKERQRIKEQHSAFAIGTLSPEQLNLWNDLIAPKPKPDVFTMIPDFEQRKRDITEEHLSLFTHLQSNREALGLTDRQARQLADLEDVLRTSIALIRYRQERDHSETGRGDIEDVVRHTQDLALIGVLSQEQEQKIRQALRASLPSYDSAIACRVPIK